MSSVIKKNRYQLPKYFKPTDVILDIGAHVGSFSYACFMRGVGKIYLFEPNSDNIQLCMMNLRRFKHKVVVNQTAIWRSDTSDCELKYTGCVESTNGANYGGGNVIFEDGLQIPVRCESLDSILSNIRQVRLLKLDCESEQEWPILFTSRLLETVSEIVGEYHEIGGQNNLVDIPPKAALPGFISYKRDDLVWFLNRHGFSVKIVGQDNSNIGLFYAKRM